MRAIAVFLDSTTTAFGSESVLVNTTIRPSFGFSFLVMLSAFQQQSLSCSFTLQLILYVTQLFNLS